MSNAFGNKCNYLSTMYNDIIKEHAEGKDEAAKILACNLSAQLLTMDLWGHRLYSWVFIETLEEAAKWSIDHKKGCSFDTYKTSLKQQIATN